MPITGIILAGGLSSRMGSDKGLVQLCRKPLISYAVDALSGLCNEIIISSASEAYNAMGFAVVKDEIPDIGPMGGIYSALRQSKTPDNLVLSCDLPFVSNDLMNYILEQSDGFEVAVPCEGTEHYEPLCGYYNQSVLGIMSDYIQKSNYKLPDLFREVAINRLQINGPFGFYHKNLFLNVNTKHDLKEAEDWFFAQKQQGRWNSK